MATLRSNSKYMANNWNRPKSSKKIRKKLIYFLPSRKEQKLSIFSHSPVIASQVQYATTPYTPSTHGAAQATSQMFKIRPHKNKPAGGSTTRKKKKNLIAARAAATGKTRKRKEAKKDISNSTHKCNGGNASFAGNMYNEGLSTYPKEYPSPIFDDSCQPNLKVCKFWGRSFLPKSLRIHQKVCKKVFWNKRKVFDSRIQRLGGTQEVLFAKNNKLKRKKKSVNKHWKKQSEHFRAVMKAVRTGKQAPRVIDKTLKKCKFCKRRFNPDVHARHIRFWEMKFKENKIKQVSEVQAKHDKIKKAINHYGRINHKRR